MSTIEAEQERCLEIGQIPNGFYDGVLIQNKEQSFDVIITVSAHLGGYLSVWSAKAGCVSGSGISV